SFLLFFFILISFPNLPAQANPESIERNVQELSHLNQKKNLSDKAIDDFLENCKKIYIQEPDLVLGYLSKLKPEIEKNRHYSAWVNYCFLIQSIYAEKGKSEQAREIIAEIYEAYAKHFNLEEEVSIRLNLAYLDSNLGNRERSQEIVREILPKAQTDFQRASIYFQRAVNLRKAGSYTKSIKDALKAIEFYKSTHDWKNTAVSYDFLGTIHNEIRNYDKVIYYYSKALEYALKSDNYLTEITISNNLGVYNKALNQIDSAVYYYNHSLSLARKYGSIRSVATSLLNLGNIYSELIKDYPKAGRYYEESLAISQKSGQLYGVYLNWFNIGRNYHLEKNYKNAKEAYDSALYYAKKLNSPLDELSVYEGFYFLHKDTENYPEALASYEEYNDLKEKINIEKTKKEITEIQAKYDVAVKDKEIQEINSQYELQRFRNRILYLALFFLLVVAGA